MEKKKFEFSKLIICCLTVTYFVGLIIGSIAVIQDPTQLTAFLTYIGGVVGITIPFYIWKAKNENVLKIQNDHPPDPIELYGDDDIILNENGVEL